MRWTEADRKRVRAALDHIVATLPGGQAEFARMIGAESRAIVNNWRRRGQVPIEHIEKVILAAQPAMILTPPMLHPDARALAAMTNRLGYQTQGAVLEKQP